MRIPKLLVLTALFAAGLARPALAADAPHDGSFTAGRCETCHKLHGGGGTLTAYSSNNLACIECHQVSASLGRVPGNAFGMPWVAADQAVPGVSGAHHNWGGAALNATYGTALPPAPMGNYIIGGNLECGTCHDPHPSSKANASTRHVSIRTTDQLPLTGVAPHGGAVGVNPQLFLTVATGTAATARGYQIVVTSFSGSSYRLVISNDAGKATPTWLKWNGTSWVAATGSTDASGTTMTTGTDYNLNDGANVKVRLTGTLASTMFWKFYVSYTFLRESNVADANGVCVHCHANRVMDHACVDGTTGTGACLPNGVNQFSHPVVGAAMGGASTVAAASMLDSDGSPQSAGDSNLTNDMVLGAGSTVGCLTCHAPHNADSNSLSVDAR